MTNARRFVLDHLSDYFNPFAAVSSEPYTLPDGRQRVRCSDDFGWNDNVDVIADYQFTEVVSNPKGRDERTTHVEVYRVYLDGSFEEVHPTEKQINILGAWIESSILKWR